MLMQLSLLARVRSLLLPSVPNFKLTLMFLIICRENVVTSRLGMIVTEFQFQTKPVSLLKKNTSVNAGVFLYLSTALSPQAVDKLLRRIHPGLPGSRTRKRQRKRKFSDIGKVGTYSASSRPLSFPTSYPAA